MNPTALLIGLAGGIASALLFAAVLGGGALATPLFALAPLPIAIAGLGWGTIGGAAAAATASILIGVVLAPAVGFAFAIVSAAPIAVYAYLIGLAREGEDGTLEWYPLARVFTAMTVLTPVTMIAVGVLLGVRVDDIAGELAEMVLAMSAESTATDVPDLETLTGIMRIYVRLMPFAMTMLWLGLMVLNLWIAARVVLKSDRLRRPWQPLPEAPGLPPVLIAALLVAIPLALADTTLGLVAAAVAGGLMMGFALQGFAAMHVLTRGNPARALLLGALYAATFMFSLPLLPVALLGAADSLLGIRRRRMASV